jgi:hypothetical protein
MCVDGHGFPHTHFAHGWLVSPEGRPVQAMCSEKAERVIAEYLEKLGEVWTFGAANSGDAISAANTRNTRAAGQSGSEHD